MASALFDADRHVRQTISGTVEVLVGFEIQTRGAQTGSSNPAFELGEGTKSFESTSTSLVSGTSAAKANATESFSSLTLGLGQVRVGECG